MKIIILGGFLGSGKTTTLLSLARFLVDNTTSDNEFKVMIIENEVGEVGIDNDFISGSGLQVDTLFNGCACCTLSGELIYTAQQIQANYNPEWIVIETTGVAYPRSMQESLIGACKTEVQIIILADANRFERQMRAMTSLITDQIEGSDAVLINKVDLVDDEAVDAIVTKIKEIEPNAQLHLTQASVGIDDAVWQSIVIEKG